MTSNPDVPPFIGYVETTVHALRLIHAARQGVIPRITRRLNDAERRTMIKSGAVFVFSVEESGIKRWTDGLLWSPSRIVGNFLVYREINERSSSRSNRRTYPTDDPSSRVLVRRNSPDQSSYRSLANGQSSTDHGTFKPNGLIKKTITVTIEGSDLHLISYYTHEDIRSGKLKRPTSRPDIMSLYMPPHIFRLTNFRVPPKMEIGPDGKARLVSEAEDAPTHECKIEEQIYNVPEPSGWSSSSSSSQLTPVDDVSPGSPVHSLSQSPNLMHASSYARPSGSNRWSGSGSENLSSSTLSVRQDVAWTPTLHSAYPSITRRRETEQISPTENWPSLNTQNTAGRWQNTLGSHDASPAQFSGYLERPRYRSSHHPYEEAANLRRDSESLSPAYPHRLSTHGSSSRETTSHRALSWHQRGLVTDGIRDGRSNASSIHHSETSFTPSPTLPFSNSGYPTHASPHSYNSSWSSADPAVMDTPGTMQALSPQSSISYDSTIYTTGSGTLAGSGEFSNNEEI